MPTPRRSRRFGHSAAHQRLMMANLAASLFAAEAIDTTEAKAKALRPIAEKCVTQGKRDTLHARRHVRRWLSDRHLVQKLFADIAPQYAERPGGYTRITKLGPRHGDGAEMAVIEFVDYSPGEGAEAAAKE